ncbi:hypothetical protein PNP85_13780 [Halobacterium salinarum]|uniref:hypothetical protein n=1 Tax=Halobacterium salinarum TaxID=2242 RepID=UPI002554CD90|nr:hypothetical protein [Halobacterium salinarum]MDL0135653.1 hypothetical protein [Halobacterium salinarum]MDL0140572.1 hypothetical protein [Halobacterium salinarum]
MAKPEFTKRYVSMPTAMWERASSAEGYNSAAEYIRSMVSAGESNIVELDPRTLNDENRSTGEGTNDPEKLVLEALDEDYKDLDTVLEDAFKELASDYLFQLAKDEDSAVEKDGFDFRINE